MSNNIFSKFILKIRGARSYFNYLYFGIVFMELIAEYFESIPIISILKIVPIPILMLIYTLNSNKISFVYLLALFLNWFTNFFFALNDVKIIFTASIIFVFCRILFLILIYRSLEYKRIILFILGCIPFLFLFLSLINLIFLNLNKGELFMILIHSGIMTLFGGFALSNYILKSDICSKYLLMSALFFSINLIILGVKFYFIDYSILKPISFLLFVLGQFTFYKFLIITEKLPIID